VAGLLLAVSRAFPRVPTCEHILRHIDPCTHTAPLLRRALLLFGPGELQALHVADAGSFSLILSVLNQVGARVPLGGKRCLEPWTRCIL
jgi:hypothetical protein